MVDLIPIGTVNRTSAENNAVKSTGNVSEADKPERAEADHKQKVDPPRRRFKRRQGDRRMAARSSRLNRFERRRNSDRRGEGDGEELIEDGVKTKAPSRKGRFIDEQA